MTLLKKEINSGYIAAQTIELEEVQFTRADGSVDTVSGRVELLANGEHEVIISSRDILRLRLSTDEFESASNAMSRAALGVINLTQHAATTEQVEAGVVEPAEKGAVQAALTFDAIPTPDEMADRAAFLARVAAESGCKRAMIGGAPFFMAHLERALRNAGITPVYAFSVRDSREEPDGLRGVRKINVFRHIGFVEAK